MNKPVKYELAKLLKEKGFEGIKSPFWYYKDGTLHKTPTKGYKGLKSWNTWEATQGIRWDAPTIAEVLMWLYEKHGIWISVKHLPFNQKFGISITGKYQDGENGILYRYDFKHYNSPTEAYEAAIQYCLKNLIN